MTIRRLDESLVVRIAAGEVIERPASVVKELVENAFDAGARVISVRVERGGLGLIEVADDGCGIPAGELPIAIERHATSKITSVTDLDRIRTMGFRGEALAAIASAGRLTVTSRPRNADAARLVVPDDYSPDRPGAGLVVEPASRAPGTTVSVRDLFARTPARLKFMKSPTGEVARIGDMLERLALARPDVAIELVREGRRVFRTDGRGRLRDTVRALFGASVADVLVEVESTMPAGTLRGLVSPPQLTRRNRTGFFVHVLGRPFEDRSIQHAVTSGYEGILPSGQFPVVFLGIEVDPAEVDVNVHPAKAEVRFRDAAALHRLVSHGIRAHIRASSPLPDFERGPSSTALLSSPSAALDTAPIPDRGSPLPGPTDDERHERVASGSASSSRAPERDELLPGIAMDRPNIRYIGEIAGRYLVGEVAEGLVLVDQHAAHERVLYDRLVAEAERGAAAVQPLLAPIVLELPASERALAEERLADFARLGFELEAWPDALALRAIPAHFARVRDAARLVRATIEELRAADERAPRLGVSHERLARAACKAAVKGTERLDEREARTLLADLVASTDPYTCPHGRPTMVRLTIAELDRRFGRLGL